jgi:hypothetical protein
VLVCRFLFLEEMRTIVPTKKIGSMTPEHSYCVTSIDEPLKVLVILMPCAVQKILYRPKNRPFARVSGELLRGNNVNAVYQKPSV